MLLGLFARRSSWNKNHKQKKKEKKNWNLSLKKLRSRATKVWPFYWILNSEEKRVHVNPMLFSNRDIEKLIVK